MKKVREFFMGKDKVSGYGGKTSRTEGGVASAMGASAKKAAKKLPSKKGK
jgi:hypothetical protein